MAVSDLFDLMPAFLSHHRDHDGSPAGRVAWCLGSAVVADTIDPETLARNMGTFQVVDVRYPNEWEAGHIDTALHIPHDDVFDRIGELDRNRPVVTVCRSGSRSAEAAGDLAGEGFDVENLDGGVQAWAARGMPLVAADGSPGAVAEPEPPPDDRPERMKRLQSEFLDVI
ncbi:MAG: rhodanese-like domain-containing protein, partial [Acidimicrobiales bacterium]